MNSNRMYRTLLNAVVLVLGTMVLAACGGGSDNASPGSIVVEVPVEGDGTDGGGTGGTGQVNPSTIPAALNAVITDSGNTASAAFGNLPIFTIDVAALTGGALDPAGLVLGNDAIYQISGGALRVTAPGAGAACAFNLKPGAILVGGGDTDFLVIEQGCQIVADGTAEQPIIFTALEEVTGNVEASDRGLWGGVVINGFAPINDCPQGATGGTPECTKEGEANSGLFGGNIADDDSGRLNCVVVKFAGSNVDPQNQLNGIAFQGVGSATEVDFVQVHNNLDNGMSIGVLAAGKYDNTYRQTDTEYARYNFTGTSVNQLNDYARETTRQTVTMSGFFNIGFELNNDNAISITHVLLRQSDDEVQQDRGVSSEFGFSFAPVENIRLQWTENEIRSTSIKGEHFFNIGEAVSGALFNWRYVDGSGLREAPDTRTYTYFEDNGLQTVSDSFTQLDAKNIFIAPDRQFQKLKDEIDEYGVDLELPFVILDRDVAVKVGYSEYERSRISEDRLFRFDVTNIAPDFVRLQTPRQLFGLDNWTEGYLDVDDFSGRAADASDIFPFAESSEETSAYYLAVDAQVTDRIRLQAGVRKEDTSLQADAFGGRTLSGSSNLVAEDYDDTLPSGSVTFEFVNDMQIRLAYSETVNRPSLLEITGSTIRNPEDAQLYRGNVFLQPAELNNYDLRWEWYFGEADSVSVGVFKKEFDQPIELGRITAENEIFTWFNAEEADLDGVEIEFRKDLFFDRWFNWGPDWDLFTLSANVSFIDSEVTLFGPGETAADVPLTGSRGLDSVFENKRQLTGQSNLLSNVMLSYSNYETGIEGSLAYNYTGERIALVGAVNAPDVIEEGRGKLDFLLKYNFVMWQTQLGLEFKLQNLLDEDVDLTQGGRVYEKFRPGVSYSLGVKMSL